MRKVEPACAIHNDWDHPNSLRLASNRSNSDLSTWPIIAKTRVICLIFDNLSIASLTI